MSLCPICTPSASASSAACTSSSITNGTPYFRAIGLIAFAFATISSCDAFFSLNCKNVAPFFNTFSTTSMRLAPLSQLVSVIAYRRSCSFLIIINSPEPNSICIITHLPVPLAYIF